MGWDMAIGCPSDIEDIDWSMLCDLAMGRGDLCCDLAEELVVPLAVSWEARILCFSNMLRPWLVLDVGGPDVSVLS
jgi:hypothetical protein